MAGIPSRKSVPFVSYTSYPHFLELINLPDSPRSAAAVAGSDAGTVRYVYAGDERPVPSDASEFVARFLDEWIVRRSPERALAFMNPDEIAKSTVKGTGSGSSAEMTKSILAMWLVRDHGMVNLLGHGVDAGLKTMSRFERLPQIEVSSLQSAITTGGERPYEMFRLMRRPNGQAQEAELYGVVFQFRHYPRDAVVLILARDAKRGWAVERLLRWNL